LRRQDARVVWWRVLSTLWSVTAAPVLQLAADRAWEQAVVVPLPADVAAAQAALGELAGAADDDVALVVLWPGEAFLGVRWPVTAVSEARDALGRVLAATGATPTASEHAVLAVLRAMLGGDPAEKLDVVEVGAVNAWRSLGPLMLWRRGQPARPEAMLAVLRARRDLLLCARPVAVEFAAQRPRPHWIGVQVSREETGGHRVDERALLELLEAVLGGASADA